MERSDEKLKQRGGLTLIAFIVLTLLGGANAVAVRFSNAELPPLWGATIRLVLAAAIVWVIVWVRRLPLPRGKAAVGAVLYGLLSFGGFLALMYLGLVHIGAGLASVVLALVPLLTLFFAFAHGLEPFRWRGLLGGLLAVAGIALAFFEQPNGNAPLLSLLAVAGAAAAMAEGSVLVKRFPQGDPMATNAVGMTAGAVVLLLLSVIMGEGRPLPVQTATWYAVFYLVVPGGVVVFSLFLYVLRRWRASAAAYQFVLLPFVAVVVAWLLLGEVVTPVFGLGGALALAGVWLGAFSKPREQGGCADPRGVRVPCAETS